MNHKNDDGTTNAMIVTAVTKYGETIRTVWGPTELDLGENYWKDMVGDPGILTTAMLAPAPGNTWKLVKTHTRA